MAYRECDHLIAPAGEKRVGADDQRAAAARNKVAKAASISRSVLAWRTWIFQPDARPAACTSFEAGSAWRDWSG